MIIYIYTTKPQYIQKLLNWKKNDCNFFFPLVFIRSFLLEPDENDNVYFLFVIFFFLLKKFYFFKIKYNLKE